MNRCLILLCFFFVLFVIEGECQSCSAPAGTQCLPIGPASCLTQVTNGTSLTWFDMQEDCVTNKGRLLWLSDHFTQQHLATTQQSLTGTGFSAIDFIVIGLLHSMKGDDGNFWSSPGDSKTLSCGTEDTALCLPSSTTEKQCNTIGCCWLNGKCQYPERQWLPEKTGSDTIDTSAISGTSKRSCVGLQKSGKDWNFKAFDCSMASAANTGYVCEYKCQTDWEARPLTNVTWPRTGGPTGKTPIGKTPGDRNRAGKLSGSQVMFSICGAILLLMMYEATFSIMI